MIKHPTTRDQSELPVGRRSVHLGGGKCRFRIPGGAGDGEADNSATARHFNSIADG